MGDFQKLWKTGKMKDATNMKPENRENIVNMCELIMKQGAEWSEEKTMKDDIIDIVRKHKGRIGGYNFEKTICVKKLGLCKRTTLHASDDDDDDDDDDEGEL